ncbi:peptide chain release factor N(5)-glutamine methyltransferase [Sporolactobacillus sp. THM7-7]|nr:peptide chain release factor N(5)-glutamine methyltransferase [Sporolactobacillus sp. THM7-7]
MKRFEALRWAADFLKKHHRDENIGELLLRHRLGVTRTDLFSDIQEGLPESDAAWLKERVREHALFGTPVQYMIGRVSFYGRSFKVTPNVLIPRPETEELVYRTGIWAERYFPESRSLAVCDIGCGSGAIAVTLALEHPKWRVSAVDISERALAVAEENAKNLGARIDFYRGDLLDPLVGRTFDVLVSNPPYITRSEMDELSDTVKNYEPRLALFGGADGLDFYRRILEAVPGVIGSAPFFLMAFEIGAAQGRPVASLIRNAFTDRIETLTVEQDVSGYDRNVMAVIRTDRKLP